MNKTCTLILVTKFKYTHNFRAEGPLWTCLSLTHKFSNSQIYSHNLWLIPQEQSFLQIFFKEQNINLTFWDIFNFIVLTLNFVSGNKIKLFWLFSCLAVFLYISVYLISQLLRSYGQFVLVFAVFYSVSQFDSLLLFLNKHLWSIWQHRRTTFTWIHFMYFVLWLFTVYLWLKNFSRDVLFGAKICVGTLVVSKPGHSLSIIKFHSIIRVLKHNSNT